MNKTQMIFFGLGVLLVVGIIMFAKDMGKDRAGQAVGSDGDLVRRTNYNVYLNINNCLL